MLSSEDSILINKLIREAAKIQWERAVKQESSSPKSTKEKSLEFRETTRLRRKQVTRDLTPQEYTLITDFYKRIVSKADPDVLLDLLVTEVSHTFHKFVVLTLIFIFSIGYSTH